MTSYMEGKPLVPEQELRWVEARERSDEMDTRNSKTTIEDTYTSMKPGWKSTEFAMNALLIAGTFLLILFDKISIDEVTSLLPLFAGGGLYALSRGLAKFRN